MEWVRKIENHCGVKLKYNFCSYTNTSNVHNWLLEAKSIDRYMTGAKMLIELNDRVNSQSGGNILSSAMTFWAIFIFFIFFLELNSYKSHLKENFDRRKKKTYSLLTLKILKLRIKFNVTSKESLLARERKLLIGVVTSLPWKEGTGRGKVEMFINK